MAQDMLFLSRQVSYHIAAEQLLPHAWGEPDQIALAFTKLINRLVRRSPRGSRIFINLKEFVLRSSPGVEISLSGADKHMGEMEANAFLQTLFEKQPDENGLSSLAECKEIIRRQHGQLWADVPKQNHPTYHIVLPALQETPAMLQYGHETFKYDISIINYAMVRKRFGIKKSEHLVEQIEHYVRSLVRYPIDMVMSLSDKGIITTIYETQQGAAESLASRISQRLGKEQFRIGRKPVELSFHYQLSPLKPQNTEQKNAQAKRST